MAPGNDSLGVMLPYTPLHLLLMREVGFPLVMTSGNLTDDPIATDNDDARQRLSGIADYFLMHNRDIHAAAEDSVVRSSHGFTFMVRRSRGYAPSALPLPMEAPPTLGCGGELKNAVCLATGRYAFLGEHIGDLENELALERFRSSIARLSDQLRIEPEVVAYDLHPDYLSTKFALERDDVKLVGVQHHRAHVASCMADNRLSEPVIGAALDGLGYGDDGELWGFEFFHGDSSGLEHKATSRAVAMPGGAAAIRQPWRMALAFGLDALGDEFRKVWRWQPPEVDERKVELVRAMIGKGINSPVASSCGRLFDAVASLLGIRHTCSFEGQAAMELEAVAWRAERTESYPFEVRRTHKGLWELDFRPLIAEVASDARKGLDRARIARMFHNSLAEAVVRCCALIGKESDCSRVALSGGCFQNVLLLSLLTRSLEKAGFETFIHRDVPPNDGGISLGQVLLANGGR